MHKLIILSILCLLPLIIFAQCGEGDKVCELLTDKVDKIEKLELEKKKLIEDFEEAKIEKSKIDKKMHDLRQKKILDSATYRIEIRSLQDELNYSQSEVDKSVKAIDDAKRQQIKLLSAINEIKSENGALVENNRELEYKIKQVNKLLISKEQDIAITTTDGKKLSYLQSKISVFRLGYEKSDGTVIFKDEYKNGVLTPIRTKVNKKLTKVYISDAQYIESKQDSPFSEDGINGKILIYSDGSLVSNLPCKMEKIHNGFLQGYNYFRLELDRNLPKPLESTGDFKVAFIDDESFEKISNNETDKSKLNSYTEVKDEGYFLITNEEPIFLDYYNNYDNVNISNEDVIATTYKSIEIHLEDNNEYDEDIINVYINDNLVVDNLVLPKKDEPVIIDNTLNWGYNMVRVEVISEGETPPCTIHISFYSKDGNVITSFEKKGYKKKTDIGFIIIHGD